MKTICNNPGAISRRSLLASMGVGGLALAAHPSQGLAQSSPSQPAAPPASPSDWEHFHLGTWTRDDSGLPCFDADLERHPKPYLTLCHILSTGTAGALTDQWGNVKFITTEDGPVCLTPATGRTRSGLYAMLELEDQLHSLIYAELHQNKSIRYGTGYVDYRGDLVAGARRLTVSQYLFTPPAKDRALSCNFTFHNSGTEPISGTFSLRSDVFIHPGSSYREWVNGLRPDSGAGFACFRQAHPVLGDVLLTAGPEWSGSSRAHCLILTRRLTLVPGETLTVPVLLAYAPSIQVAERQSALATVTPAQSRQAWAKRLSSSAVPGLDRWMEDECRWSLGQLLSFEFYDPVLSQHYLHLGGYDLFPNPDDPPDHLAYTVREAAENTLVISHFEPSLAKSSLRWLAQMQLTSGDIPKNYDYTTTRNDIPHYERDSDTEIWFLMALGEYVELTGDLAFLDDILPWFPEGKDSLWDHAKRAFQWITQGIGIGQHGLILILEGDWNDYLSTVGARGKGESVMNSGMAARAFDSLARVARKRGDTAFAAEAEKWRDSLRAAVGRAFDREWFAGCYTDDGNPIAGYGDRVYLNAQSWAALGGCGTPEQRRKALLSAVEQCASKIGLLLQSKAYSSPAPPEISWAPLPGGEGENGGIWPQTVHWTVWALAQEGLLDQAFAEWQKSTLRNHARCCPDVPYGIFNGPDCWSSRLAGPFEGWSQYELFNRQVPCPMCPIISWQALSMLQIAKARARA